MENFSNPYFDKVVGLPKEHADKESGWHTYLIDNVETNGGRTIAEFEIDKTEKDLQLIQYANDAIDTLLKEYDRAKQILIPLSNIHVLKDGGTKEFTKKAFGGAHSTIQQSIIVDRFASNIQFTLVLFHELLHVKSYTAVQIMPGSDNREAHVKPYRNGISVTSRDGKVEFLGELDEAIVGFLTKQFFERTISNDSVFEDELKQVGKGTLTIDTSQSQALARLDNIIDQIFDSNGSQFSSREDIWKIFLDAHFNGNLMNVGRLLEKTFGQGSLRTLDRIDK